jgi:hypothetical protein
MQLQMGRRSVAVPGDAFDRPALGELRESHEVEEIAIPDLIVVGAVTEGQRKDPLLLQVRLVDAREAPRDDRRTAEQAGERAACSRLLPSP